MKCFTELFTFISSNYNLNILVFIWVGDMKSLFAMHDAFFNFEMIMFLFMAI